MVTFSSPLNVQKSPKKPHPLSVHSGDENRPQEEEIKEEEKMDTSLPQPRPSPEIKEEVMETALCMSCDKAILSCDSHVILRYFSSIIAKFRLCLLLFGKLPVKGSYNSISTAPIGLS